MEEIHGKVSIPAGFFNRAAKREYTYWSRALIREFLQNSVDAGASSVRFQFNKDDLTLTVEDDGCGMTRDVILNKLLVMGGTEKPEGAIGGFGKAKEVLFFAWKNYTIHTGYLLVEGVGADFVLKHVQEAFPGTKCLIKFHNSNELSMVKMSAQHVLGRNEVESDLLLDGKLISCVLVKGEEIHDLPWAKVYASNQSSSTLSIRLRGMEMFSWWTRELPKQLVIELKGESVDVLTASRDGLQADCKKELDSLVENFLLDPISTCKKIDGIDELIVGHGDHVFSADPSPTDKETDQSLLALIDDLMTDEIPESELSLPGFALNFMIRRAESADLDDVRSFLASSRALRLARTWAAVIFDIISSTDLRKKIPAFRPGFVFIEGVNGGFLEKCGHPPAILLNPQSDSLLESEEMGDETLTAFLEDVAYHELAHSEMRVHDERFVLRMRDNRLQHRKWKWRRRNRGEADDSTSIERSGSPP